MTRIITISRLLFLLSLLATFSFLSAWFGDDWVIRFFNNIYQKKQPAEKIKRKDDKSLKYHKYGFNKDSRNRKKNREQPPVKRKDKFISMPQTAKIINVDIKDLKGDNNNNTMMIGIIHDLLSASVQLMEVHMNMNSSRIMTKGNNNESSISSNVGGTVFGDFCRLSFDVSKEDPTSVPMFRHLVQKSDSCREKRYRVDIKAFAEFARKHDDNNNREESSSSSSTKVKVLSLGGVIFHQSRCGSTLISNALQAMNPASHRVYSEAQPEMVLNFCGDSFQHCSKEVATELFKDVVYIMSRSNDMKEEKLFYKFHSDSSRNLPVFQEAFPDTPWIFVYRNPIHIIVSQFKEGKSIAKCVRAKKSPSQQVVDLLLSKKLVSSLSEINTTSPEIFCAATLATYCESALRAATKENSPPSRITRTTFVHYPELPEILLTEIFPQKFGLSISEKQKEIIQSISGMYSKASHGRARPYRDDSDLKEKKATDAIREAVRHLLQKPYEQLLQASSLSSSSSNIGTIHNKNNYNNMMDDDESKYHNDSEL